MITTQELEALLPGILVVEVPPGAAVLVPELEALLVAPASLKDGRERNSRNVNIESDN